MTTFERAASIHGGCDCHWGDRHWAHEWNNDLDIGNIIPRKSHDIPLHTEAAIRRTEIESEGSEFSFGTRPDTSQRKLNKWQAALIYITNQVGVGILGLPSVMQTLGLIPGIVCIIGLGTFGRAIPIDIITDRPSPGLVVTYTAYVLLQFVRRYPGVLSCVDCFRIIGGAPLAAVVGVGFVLNQIFGCSSAILAMSIALNSISEHAACTVVFILIPAVVSWILCMPRRMKFSAHFGSKFLSDYPTLSPSADLLLVPCTISILAAVLIVMIALGVAGPSGAPPGWDKEIVLVGDPSFAEAFTSILNIAFAYAGNQAMVTVMAEMKNASRDFMPSVFILQGFAIPMYAIVGAVIYGLAGQHTTSPALGAAPIITAKVAYGVLLPTLLGTSLVYGHTSIKYIFVECLRLMKIEHEHDRDTRRTWTLWIGIGTIFWILAFVLANAIPLFHSILSVSAALFVSWFTFGISGVMWLYLNWEVQFRDWRKISLAVVNWAIVAFTLFANVVGLWASIEQLIAAYNDPLVPVNGSFTCADNSVWSKLGIDV
jgi:hypothetical protein